MKVRIFLPWRKLGDTQHYRRRIIGTYTPAPLKYKELNIRDKKTRPRWECNSDLLGFPSGETVKQAKKIYDTFATKELGGYLL